MSPEEFFNDFVLPNLAEFRAGPTDKRLAANAAVAMYHMIDYAAFSLLPPGYSENARRKKVEDLRKQVRNSCCEFKLIDDLAHAYKHCVATRGKRTFQDLLQVQSHIASAFADGSYYSDGSSHADREQVVAVQDAAGGWIDLRHCLETARRYWDRYLSTGVL